MNQIIKKENIENLIYEVRGKQVMLDRDLARLYQVETRTLNQAVKRNIERFPNEFCFQMNNIEFMNWRSQFVISNNDKIGLRRPPYVFTEQGVAMLSGVLHSKIAISTSIAIINAFISMKKYISTNLLEQKYYNDMIIRHDSEIKSLQESFNKFEEKKSNIETYYNGQIYDAYSKIIDIFKTAKKELIIIDRYADKNTLDMIKDLDINVVLVIKRNGLLKKIDIEKYNRQYNNLKIIYNDNYHDRYFVIDKKEVYHCGTSINHAGSRTFSINKWEDKWVCENFIDNINHIL